MNILNECTFLTQEQIRDIEERYAGRYPGQYVTTGVDNDSPNLAGSKNARYGNSRINANDWEGAKEQLMLWTRGGGKVLPGLLKRRTAECALLD